MCTTIDYLQWCSTGYELYWGISTSQSPLIPSTHQGCCWMGCFKKGHELRVSPLLHHYTTDYLIDELSRDPLTPLKPWLSWYMYFFERLKEQMSEKSTMQRFIMHCVWGHSGPGPVSRFRGVSFCSLAVYGKIAFWAWWGLAAVPRVGTGKESTRHYIVSPASSFLEYIHDANRKTHWFSAIFPDAPWGKLCEPVLGWLAFNKLG